MIKIVCCVFSFFVINLSSGFAQELKDTTQEMKIPDIVAKVNDTKITSKFVKFRLNLDAQRFGNDIPETEKVKIAKEIIQKEIVRELIFQEGSKQNEKIPDEEIGKEFEKLKKAYKNETEFQVALRQRDLSENDLIKTIRVDLTAQKLLDKQIKGKINIEDSAVQSFYDANKDRFHRPESYHSQHIFIPFVPLEDVQKMGKEELQKQLPQYNEKAKKKIDSVLKELKSGGSFEELAKKYSEDKATSENGGDLGFIYKGVFDPAFDEAVSKLKKGETSDIVKTDFGYHIIKLKETRPEEDVPFKDVKGEIQKHLFMQEAQKKVGEYIEGLRKKAKIEVFY